MQIKRKESEEGMDSHCIGLIRDAEEIIGIKSSTINIYKRVGDIYIRSNRSLKDVFHDLSHSELPLSPNWKKIIGALFFRKNVDFNRVVGIKNSWAFLPRYSLSISPDIIYLRKDAIVLIYTSKKKVVKIARTGAASAIMTREVRAQNVASQIKSNTVIIPSILYEHFSSNLNFTVEAYVESRKLSFDNPLLLKRAYSCVFNFLVEFYALNTFELRCPSDFNFMDDQKVNALIRSTEGGSSLMDFYNVLLEKGKKIVMVMIHGDLNHYNVRTSKDAVVLIDWGRSKMNFLLRELDTQSFDASEVFIKVLDKLNINYTEVYDFEEQKFLFRYIELNRTLHRSVRNSRDSQIGAWLPEMIWKCLVAKNLISWEKYE